jgi:hypothetical protein
MIDWEEKRLGSLLEAGHRAISRARYVFVAINITGILLLGGMFNANVPWIRNAIYREEAKKDSVDPDSLKMIRQVRQVDLGTVAIPILGMKFSVWDLPVLGSAAMAILVLWYRYSLRRENLVVHQVWKAAMDPGPAIQDPATTQERAAYLYHGIAHYFVFLGTHEADQVASASNGKVLVARYSVRILEFMPAWVPFLAIAGDVATMFFPSAAGVAGSHIPLGKQMGHAEFVEAIIRFAVGLIFVGFCAVQCWQCYKYHFDTMKIVDTFRGAVDKSFENRRELPVLPVAQTPAVKPVSPAEPPKTI